jgi:hypothetical protein
MNLKFKLNQKRIFKILLINILLIISYLGYYFSKIQKLAVEAVNKTIDTAGSEAVQGIYASSPTLAPESVFVSPTLALGIPEFISILILITFVLILYSPFFRLIGSGEQKIIQVLEQKGPMTGYKLISETKLPRSSTYEFIKKLMREKIIFKEGEKIVLAEEVKQEITR